VGTGEDLDRFRELAVAGHRTVVVGVGAHQVGEHLGVARVGLGTRGGVAVAIAADRERVDGIDLVPGGDQTLHQEAAVGLDADDHRRRVVGVVRNQLMDPPEPVQPFRNPSLAQHPAGLIQQTEVVMGLRPVDTQVDQPLSSRPPDTTSRRRSAAP
jgi:hypothetical protein